MPTSVTMPRLGESVTEGTVTRWLKQEGDSVEADEPLLEVSTDKVDTEVPSPASGTLLSIKVREDETVEIGVELAVIGEAGESPDGAGGGGGAQEQAPEQQPAQQEAQPAEQGEPEPEQVAEQVAPEDEGAAAPQQASAPPQPSEPQQGSAAQQAPTQQLAQAPAPAPYAGPGPQSGGGAYPVPAEAPEPDAAQSRDGNAAAAAPASNPPAAGGAGGSDEDEVAGTYVTPLVRKLASEHGVDLNSLHGTGVGGRIRKSDVLAAADRQAEARRQAAAAPPAPSRPEPVSAVAQPPSAPTTGQATVAPQATSAAAVTAVRGQVEPMSRMRQVIATRMVESLQTSAQLTTVVEVDVTRIARLREQAKASFEAREGVKLSFLPFFAIAAIEALKAHPAVNASVDMQAKTVTYHDAEHLGVAVDTERGLLVPVIHNAGDLNLGGIARKIADLAERTRSNRITPDELGGGTFTITNTGSRGALFDTPIINQPQVAILGTGAVVKRPVVVTDDDLGETIAIRSMVYLALTYDHRIVDGADAARFLVTVKQRLEAGAFERSLGLAS